MVYNIPRTLDAALCEGLRECGSLRATRKTWARFIETLGVDCFRYLQRKAGEIQPSLENCSSEIVAQGDCTAATVNIVTENVVEFVTPNGVSVNFTDNGPEALIVAVHFNRNSAYLATMMLAAFARRVPDAYPLLAIAAAELAATHK